MGVIQAADVSLTSRIETVWRLEAPRLIGGLMRVVRDVSLAEDLAQEALVVALEQWPITGVPDNPGAWLMTCAKNRALDLARRGKMLEQKHATLQDDAPRFALPVELDDGQDDLLRLVLISCHPVLSREARVSLTLRLVAGLSTDEIARAFLTTEPTIAQRIVRAKRTLSEARVPFEVPTGPALLERIPSVLEVIYLVFNEGYAASKGDDLLRPRLCEDAMRVGRMLAARLPEDTEVHGLVALMALQASRFRARVDANGDVVLLQDQRRALWDRTLIQVGLEALSRAEAKHPLGPYALQAAIAACHARAPSVEATDWARIVALYDALVELTGSPVVELNRAVAVCMAEGPMVALELVDELAAEPLLQGNHLLHAVRGDVLERLGRFEEARLEFELAASRAGNERERAVLTRRARQQPTRPSS